MIKQLKIVCNTIALVVLLSTTHALAEEDNHEHELHGGDIQPWRVGAEIFANSALFETDFGDLSGGPFVTDDPGIDVNVQEGGFTPGNWLRYQPVGQLFFWDGTQWTDVAPNGERIEITDALSNVISYSTGGVSETAGVIGEADSNGGVHEHLSFAIFDASNTPNGSAGAYRIQFKLFESLPQSDTSVSIATSPTTIVFNRGLETESFELAVAAAENLNDNSVFVDETGALTIQRVKASGTVYKVKMQYIGNSQFQLTEVEEVIDAH
ncbi:MAG TPA: hypothetical protein PKM20_00475 [Nitrosomonas sp.]|uniref:hypothetical protein n=1 Tax=Nitrosomonas sp. TaxID=42353 RepID=UPI0020858F62|nr:hypothetical protein [Nitrosomonas sp.]GJL75690.1 MAG: hypothetical protein NMNS02_17960 [Nitrosomonas sp.]HNP25188.1 hypothetical protein [Nitrosomonas sp.]